MRKGTKKVASALCALAGVLTLSLTGCSYKPGPACTLKVVYVRSSATADVYRATLTPAHGRGGHLRVAVWSHGGNPTPSDEGRTRTVTVRKTGGVIHGMDVRDSDRTIGMCTKFIR